MKLSIINTQLLSEHETDLLVADIHDIINDEHRTQEDAEKVLLSRIGGQSAVTSYVRTLEAGERYRDKQEVSKLRRERDEAVALFRSLAYSTRFQAMTVSDAVLELRINGAIPASLSRLDAMVERDTLREALRAIVDLCPAMFHDGTTLAGSMRRIALRALERKG